MAAIRRHHRALLLLLLLAGLLAMLLAASHCSHASAILLALVPFVLFECLLTSVRRAQQPCPPESLPHPASARPALFQLPPPLPTA